MSMEQDKTQGGNGTISGIKPYYTDPYCTIYNADCLDVMAQMQPKSVDLVLTDPPYGIGESNEKNGTRGNLASPKDYGHYSWDKNRLPEHVKLALTIPGTLPDLNAYINAERSNKYAAAKMKKDAEKKIILCIKQAKIKPVTNYPVTLVYFWCCPDKRKDKSNIMFGQKAIEDSLIRAGILRNDGWSELNDPIHFFGIDKNNPRIVVKIDEREG